MPRKSIAASLALMLALGLFAVAAGCGKTEQAVEDTGTAGSREQSGGSTATAPDPARTVTMNGRSVMSGWMDHWGYTWEGPVERNGYFLDYRELNGDDIASSFAANVEGLAPASVVFFKFCFVDFDGSNLEQREQEVEEVIQTAKDRGLKLIIGNALPVRKADGNPELLREYKDFNAFLLGKARDNPGVVWAYDFYGVLAGSDGWLKPGYDTGDSHPTSEAYSALDPSFFELLGGVFGR